MLVNTVECDIEGNEVEGVKDCCLLIHGCIALFKKPLKNSENKEQP